MLRSGTIQYKTEAEITKMRAAGIVVGRTLEVLKEAVRPGVTTAELDALAEETIRAAGAVPSFQGYGYPPYPATICASVNDEVVHGIPGPRVLREGDIISLDCGAIVDGWHGDAAVTVPVGEVAPELTELMRVCEDALWHAMTTVKLGGRLTDIGHAVARYAASQGRRYGIPPEYTGHGIGTEMHQDPQVLNYGRPGRGPKLVRGLVLAVEPMLTLGTSRTVVAPDQWTVRTADGSYAAHFEHTFTLTESGPRVLTALDEGRSRLGTA